MTQFLRAQACLLVALLGASGAHANECSERLDKASRSELSKSVHEFDQNASAGWRALQNAGCAEEAATLIERYLVGYESNLRTLRWHRAQLLALTGRYAEAIELARKSYNPAEAEQFPAFKWNAYVAATIAFLGKDREELSKQRGVLELAAKVEPANEANLEVVKGMEKCFDQSYERAYGGCEDKR